MSSNFLESLGIRKPPVIDALRAAQEGNQELSKFLLKHNSFQEEALEYVLRKAVETSNMFAVRTLLQRGVNPNAPNQHLGHQTFGGDDQLDDIAPIQFALSTDKYEIFYLLRKAGAEVNAEQLEDMISLLSSQAFNDRCHSILMSLMISGHDVSKIGPSALEAAAKGQRLLTCGMFLELGAPINTYGGGGKTALQRSASHGNLVLTQFLVDQGSDINFPAYPDGGRTALQAAAENLDYRTINFLINAGADVKGQPAIRNGVSVIEAFASGSLQALQVRESKVSGLVSMLKHLLSLGAPVNRPEGVGNGVVFCFVRSKSYECVEIVLQAGANIEGRWPQHDSTTGESLRGKTALQQAASDGDLDAFNLLMKHGADVNAPTDDLYGRTALQEATAATSISHSLVEALLSNGAKVNAPPAKRGGITALQGAAAKGEAHIAKILLANGADVNALGSEVDGRSALEIAAEWGRLDMVRLLLDAGAAPNAISGFSRAIELAQKNGNLLVADFLREYENAASAAALQTGVDVGGILELLPTQGFIIPDTEFDDFTL
ncbi:ankyrin repeat protein [Colletotrichum kahawae]|uniref:Ankyrin repeat protein n=1 Tax=Colletotrichum kahawae TaxID=34407 RepID=A0AAD9Y0U8_COLKA|nr:ankyrin repeat protein [Colletotrichum kahawae]